MDNEQESVTDYVREGEACKHKTLQESDGARCAAESTHTTITPNSPDNPNNPNNPNNANNLNNCNNFNNPNILTACVVASAETSPTAEGIDKSGTVLEKGEGGSLASVTLKLATSIFDQTDDASGSSLVITQEHTPSPDIDMNVECAPRPSQGKYLFFNIYFYDLNSTCNVVHDRRGREFRQRVSNTVWPPRNHVSSALLKIAVTITACL
jgi:hypothetical protein